MTAARWLETHSLACYLLVNSLVLLAQYIHNQIPESLLNNECHGVQIVAV